MLGLVFSVQGEAAIVANTVATLAGLAVLGAFLPLTHAGCVAGYAAVFRPGSDMREAVARVSEAGPGWRVLRVLASRPMPILMVVHEAGAGPSPDALLLPVPSAPGCRFTSSGR